jgi:Glycosyl hydrolase family 76
VRLRTGLTALLVLGLTAAAAAAADPPALPPSAQLKADRAAFLRVAEEGIPETRKLWGDGKTRWYRGVLTGDPTLATTWTAFPLLEATSALAIARPTKANKQAVDEIALRAESFWDPTIVGGGGVSWRFGLRNTGNAYFDDTGWWGVSYLDAYRATGKKRWLWNAGRALAFIDREGWDRPGGGVWWNVAHSHKTSEPLAAGALIAATLYRYQRKPYFLKTAKRYIAWADAHTRNPRQDNLYGRSDVDGTVMDYVEGMFIGAHVELCRATKDKSWCAKARRIANGSLSQFPILADWAPETDVVYLRWLLDLYEVDGNKRWYAVVYANAARAIQSARDDKGLWSLRWDGTWTAPGVLYTQAATLQLFAWMAAAPLPKA